MEKRGILWWDELGNWIIAIVILVIVLIAIWILINRGSGWIDVFKSYFSGR